MLRFQYAQNQTTLLIISVCSAALLNVSVEANVNIVASTRKPLFRPSPPPPAQKMNKKKKKNDQRGLLARGGTQKIILRILHKKIMPKKGLL